MNGIRYSIDNHPKARCGVSKASRNEAGFGEYDPKGEKTEERRMAVKMIFVASLMTTLSIPISTVDTVVRTIEKMFM